MIERLTSSPRIRETGLLIMRVAALGVVALLVKDRRTKEAALDHLGDLVIQLID